MKLTLRSALAVMALAGLLLTGLLVSSARADVVDLACTTEQQTTYSPGVRLFPSPQTIQITSTFDNCVSPTQPAITSGSASFSFQGTRSCLALDRTISGTSFITWNTGQTTTYTYSSRTATIGGQIVVTIVGTVTSGPFQGDRITITIASPTIDVLKCVTPPGITSRTGVGTAVITSL